MLGDRDRRSTRPWGPNAVRGAERLPSPGRCAARRRAGDHPVPAVGITVGHRLVGPHRPVLCSSWASSGSGGRSGRIAQSSVSTPEHANKVSVYILRLSDWKRAGGVSAVGAETVTAMERHWEDGWNGEDTDLIVGPFAADIILARHSCHASWTTRRSPPSRATTPSASTWPTRSVAPPPESATRSTGRTRAPTASSSCTPSTTPTAPTGWAPTRCA